MIDPKDVAVVTPKIEAVEYWSLIGNSGVSALYMVRVERGEKAQLLRNQIDNTPIEVQILLRTDDEKNEVAGTLSFPIPNLFSYGMENGTYAVYPKGYSPAEKAVEKQLQSQHDSLLIRKRRIEAIVGGISDLSDGTVPPPDVPPSVTIIT